MDRRERSVEIREFKEDGLDDTTLKFSSLVTEERIRSIRNYLMIRPFIKVAGAIANTGNVIDRKLNGIE